MVKPSTKKSATTRRVVIVDTCRDTVETLTLLLRSAGCEVRSRLDGDGVLDLVDEFQPHVMFLESHLGDGMSGLDIARALSGRRRSKRPVIVMVSGWAQDSHRIAAFAACSDYFYAKPADPDLLVLHALKG